MFAAVVWHFWLGLVLFLAAVGLVVQTLVGYVMKVSATRYPNRLQRRAAKK
jgi:uncharacterized integral membrane protein